jgi:hypothetical protein
MPSTVTYKMEELGTGREFAVRGTGNTRAQALAEAQAKLQLTVGTQVSGSVSEPLSGADLGAANGGSQFSDAVLVLGKAGAAKRSIILDNISTAYALSGSAGLIDTNNPDIQAFAAAFVDGDGNAGYQVISGEYVR